MSATHGEGTAGHTAFGRLGGVRSPKVGSPEQIPLRLDLTSFLDSTFPAISSRLSSPRRVAAGQEGSVGTSLQQVYPALCILTFVVCVNM